MRRTTSRQIQFYASVASINTLSTFKCHGAQKECRCFVIISYFASLYCMRSVFCATLVFHAAHHRTYYQLVVGILVPIG